MPLAISTHFSFTAQQATDCLLQFEAADIPEQRVLSCETTLSESAHCVRVPAQDDIGERFWIRAEGAFEVRYEAKVGVERILPDIASLRRVEPHALPGATVQYLFDSRYCAADKFQSFVEAEFGENEGGARIVAMRDWIAQHFTYAPGSSGPTTTARDSFIERRGVCRDYAHVMIAFARASGIPARYVSGYGPDVTPQDFHAVAEVFLDDASVPGGGAWYLVDATGMAKASEIAKIGVGRDAADVSFMTSFGLVDFHGQHVQVERHGAD
ncbi:transglutaminase-like domain-containing protein [Parerythrobacter jejuensis]|uniref:Transglutaminase family protein n=1 Tax=Parerythrobacter jejuensis TaxID=795812 RepID=A0A845ASK3_9SPHN|nr:transglutaminase family protein [Parerythrobacter jejuensis]MXP31486.1 transglutaminase family protein [Parerythrobacter jejuensis]